MSPKQNRSDAQLVEAKLLVREKARKRIQSKRKDPAFRQSEAEATKASMKRKRMDPAFRQSEAESKKRRRAALKERHSAMGKREVMSTETEPSRPEPPAADDTFLEMMSADLDFHVLDEEEYEKVFEETALASLMKQFPGVIGDMELTPTMISTLSTEKRENKYRHAKLYALLHIKLEPFLGMTDFVQWVVNSVIDDLFPTGISKNAESYILHIQYSMGSYQSSLYFMQALHPDNKLHLPNLIMKFLYDVVNLGIILVCVWCIPEVARTISSGDPFVLTAQDMAHAVEYAFQFVLKHRFDHQATDTRWHLPPYELQEGPCPFHCPPTLTCPMYTLVFPPSSCQAMSCFRFIEGGDPCPPDSPPRDIQVGLRTYRACQPFCHLNLRDGVFPFHDELHHVEGKCLRKNTLFKTWCLFPARRSDKPMPTYVPPFDYDDGTGDCRVTAAYCTRFGLDYDDGSGCVRSSGQAFAEDYLIGQTIFRSFKMWGESSGKRRKRAIAEPVTEESALVEIISELGMDVGIDATFWGARQLALASIPLYSSPAMKVLLANLERMYGPTVMKHATISILAHAIRSNVTAAIAIKVASTLGTASTVVGATLLGIQLAGLVLDLVDPLDLTHHVDQAHVDLMKQAFTDQFYSLLGTKANTEVTPLGLMEVMTKGQLNEEENRLLFTHTAEYLSKLEVNALGEDMTSVPAPPTTLDDYLAHWHRSSQSHPPLDRVLETYFSYTSLASAILLALFFAVAI